MDDMEDRVSRWGKRKVTQINVTNRDCVTPPQELSCPEFSFVLDYDFNLRRRQEGIRGLYEEQRERFCDIITALLNTSGGVLMLDSILPINKGLLSTWLSNAAQLLACVPRDVLHCGALDYIIHENCVNILVKKAPDIITHKSHLYTRSTDANSYMCYDAQAIRSIMMQKESASRTRLIPSVYGQLLDPEDKLTEYKYFKVTKSVEIIDKLEQDVNCIFALGNIPGGGDVFIGVQEVRQQYILNGIYIDHTEQAQFKHDFTEWMVKSRDGAHRIWGEEGTVPVEGHQWSVNFIPLSGCPIGDQRVLLQIHINFCEGGLFERAPESCIVNNKGCISLLSFQEWSEMVLSEYQNDRSLISSSPVKQVETHTSSRLKNVETQTSSAIKNKTSLSSIFKRMKSIPKFKRKHQDSAKHPKKSDDSSSDPSQNTEIQPSTSHASKVETGGLGVVSWAESQSNAKYLSKTRHCADTSYLTQPCTIPEGDPIQFFPNKDQFMRLATSKIDPVLFAREKIVHTLLQLEDRYKGKSGFAIPLISWAELIGLNTHKARQLGHLFDILVGSGNNLDVWPVFCDLQSDLPLKHCYAYEVCRILKRNLLFLAKQRAVQNLRINPMMYCPQTGSVESGLDQTQSPLVGDMNGTWSPREGISKLALTEALVSLLMAGTDTWIKDRFGREKHYNLTEMQLRSSLQCLNGIVNLMEGPPGAGKSIIVSYLCDVYGGPDRKDKVLCLCPRKPFSKYLEFQDKSTVVHIDSPEKMEELINEIGDSSYEAVIADDSQDMPLTDKIWASLYLIIYQIWTSGMTTRLFIFLDSQMQIFSDIDQARIARDAFRKFIDEHHISFTDLSLHEVLRNTQNVFSFMAANVFRDPTLSKSEIYSRHPLPGDDVSMHGKMNLWEDSANNGLLKHILHLLSTYDLSDIVVLVDREEDAVFLRKLFKRCWPISQPGIIVNDAMIFPVCGLTVETTHNFLGLEARVCIHARRADNTRVLDDTRYRVYIASRGTERVDFFFPSSFDAHKARAMGYEDLSAAKTSEETEAAEDKEKQGTRADYTLSQSYGGKGSGAGEFNTPWGVTISPITENVAISDMNNHRIHILTSDLHPIRVFGTEGSGERQFYHPAGVCFSSTGGLFIADMLNHRIKQVTEEGEHINTFGAKGSALGQFKEPHGICWEGGLLYICDRYNSRLQVVKESGEHVRTISSYGSPQGQLLRFPWFIAMSGHHDKLVVSDSSGNLHFFTLDGLYKKTISAGQSPYNIQKASGVTIDSEGQVIVSDYEGGCVVVLGEDRVISTLILPTGEEMGVPRGVTVTHTGSIIVSDGDKHKICKYTSHH